MDLTNIVANVATTIVLGLISTLGGYAVAWLRKHLGGRNLEIASGIAKAAVNAAEQIGAARGWHSADKYDAALGRCRDLAAQSGIRFTDAAWSSLIEQSVAELKQLGREIAAPAPPALVASAGTLTSLTNLQAAAPVVPAATVT